MANITGTQGNDVLIGRDREDDVLSGLGGNDRLRGRGGNDLLRGADGDDLLLGGDGDDRLLGDRDNDDLRGGLGNDELSGGLGNDLLRGNDGNDVLYGEAGHDVLAGGGGNNRLFGGAGNDVIYALDGHDRLAGGSGDDRLYGKAGDDVLRGGYGADLLSGGLGSDVLRGEAGQDRLGGSAGNDRLFGGSGRDLLLGEVGDDRLFGEAANDRLNGGDGADVLNGGAGDDVLLGGTGGDVLFGRDGADVLEGGDGDDVLNGGAGPDVLTGGAGADVFAFGGAGHGLDVITDFDVNADSLDLSVALMRYDAGKDIEDFVRFRATAEGTVVSVNADGAGGDFVDLVLLQGVNVPSLPLTRLGFSEPVEVTDPFPEPIVKGDIVVDIADFVQVPPGVVDPPLARLNGLYHAEDGTGRLFVNDTRGPMYVIEDGVLNPTPILDLRFDLPNEWFKDHDLWDGFRDFAFHPDFENPGTEGFGKLYISYTANVASAALHPDTPLFELNRPDDPNGIRHHDVIAELDLNPTTLEVDLGSYRELMRIENPHTHHNIGELGFDPNARPGDADYGKLYASIGDAQFGDGEFYPYDPDPLNVGQDRGVLPGSIIRIDPLQSGDQPYTVPGDNPFVGEAGVLPEIWAYGLRHPQYFSWDTGGDGKMLIGEIGETMVEEINVGIPGANYGWSEREGTFVIDQGNSGAIYELPAHDALRGFTYPVLQYDHDEGHAIATGYVYRGSKVPELYGKYVFGDLANGRLFYTDVDDLVPGGQPEIKELRLRYNGQEMSLTEIISEHLGQFTDRAELRFGQDEDGEIYILSKWDGMVRTFVSPGGSAQALALQDVLGDEGGPSGGGDAARAAYAADQGWNAGLDELLGSPIAVA